MESNTFRWEDARQFNWWQLLLATFIPSGIAFFLFHIVLPRLVANGGGRLSSWATVASIGLFAFSLGGLFLLNKEAKELGVSIWKRMSLRGLSLRQWGLYIVLLVVALLLAFLIQPVTVGFMEALDFFPPDYFPFILDPRIDPLSAPESVISPNLAIRGNYSLIPLMLVALALNILTEELYFRAWMLPKMVKWGNWGWVLNGVLFAFYHSFQLWLLPTLLVASLSFAFLFYRSRSLWVVFVGHLVGNFLVTALGLVALIAS